MQAHQWNKSMRYTPAIQPLERREIASLKWKAFLSHFCRSVAARVNTQEAQEFYPNSGAFSPLLVDEARSLPRPTVRLRSNVVRGRHLMLRSCGTTNGLKRTRRYLHPRCLPFVVARGCLPSVPSPNP